MPAPTIDPLVVGDVGSPAIDTRTLIRVSNEFLSEGFSGLHVDQLPAVAEILRVVRAAGGIQHLVPRYYKGNPVSTQFPFSKFFHSAMNGVGGPPPEGFNELVETAKTTLYDFGLSIIALTSGGDLRHTMGGKECHAANQCQIKSYRTGFTNLAPHSDQSHLTFVGQDLPGLWTRDLPTGIDEDYGRPQILGLPEWGDDTDAQYFLQNTVAILSGDESAWFRGHSAVHDVFPKFEAGTFDGTRNSFVYFLGYWRKAIEERRAELAEVTELADAFGLSLTSV